MFEILLCQLHYKLNLYNKASKKMCHISFVFFFVSMTTRKKEQYCQETWEKHLELQAAHLGMDLDRNKNHPENSHTQNEL